MVDPFPDAFSSFGKRVRQRLRDEKVIWFTTVGGDGTPQPNPVWFLLQGNSILIYNRPDAHRLNHVERRPRVSLNLDGNGVGGDIIVVTGEAALDADAPLPHELPEYMAKYEALMGRVSGSPEGFSKEYPVPLRIAIARIRGF
ncbi:MAG: TIGR03667 family PPOX class F420-dependent oxidoreductase [Mycobacteriaceae bacterium]|nr:TIGR03667 family PPOX class F420-dependent oxidoreductase [Mycobacteriaceae bacterium]